MVARLERRQASVTGHIGMGGIRSQSGNNADASERKCGSFVPCCESWIANRWIASD
jgi:hypothetical protein